MSPIKILLLAAGILMTKPGSGQFADAFSDGDFLDAPTWQGDATSFNVVNSRLRLQAPPVSGNAQLATASKAVHEASWEFTIQLDFTPSSTNYAKVYLVSDRSDLRLPLNGYFVKIGNTAREVSLYRQTGSSEFELIDGQDDRVNFTSVNLGVRVARDAEGNWQLFSDVGNTGFPSREGVAMDVTHTRSAWFGVLCVYTATRSDKFWFDDFAVAGSEVPDVQPPAIVRAEANDPRQVDVWFSEVIAPSSILLTSVEVKGQGNPVSIAQIDSGMAIRCTLPQPLVNGVSYEIGVSGLADLAGNAMPLTKWDVRYFRPGAPLPKCVLITEVFADPSPQVGLPATEYIELYNPGTEPFDLRDWVLTDGSSSGLFPDRVLLPNTYLVVTAVSGADLFGQLPLVALSNFPSLNNAGDRLLLKDNKGQPIDSVNYASTWYRDEDKASGGWALELIDVANPCGEGDNWTASDDARGGTPGEPNSVASNKPDLTPPSVLTIRTIDSALVVIAFNEILQPSSLKEARVELLPAITVHTVQLDPSRKKIEARLETGLLGSTPYRIRLEGFRDCTGNLMEPVELRFGLSEPADSLDVLLSEVLFNPRAGGVDFVEVFNVSKKYIDLENYILSNGSSDVLLPAGQLSPGEWLALTPDTVIVRSHYPQAAESTLLTSNLPPFPNDEGAIRLYSKSRQLLDQLQYKEDWHSVFLRSAEGVSLERVSFFSPTQSRDNWVSASSLSGFATPGLPNSHQRGANPTVGRISVIPEIFSPGSVPYDFVQILYRFDVPGSVTNIRIYDRQGIPVKVLANNETMGTEGFLRWDGDRDNGSRVPAGYYVLWVEFFDTTGRVETIRRRIVVAAP